MGIESNYAGYVFFETGFIKQEVALDTSKIRLTDYFIEVKNLHEADAFAVTFYREGEGEVIVHMGILDPNNKLLIHHRPAFGANVRTEPWWIVRREYDNPNFLIKFLKLKTVPTDG